MEFLDIVKKLNVDVTDFAQVYAMTLGRVFCVQQALETKVIKGQKARVNFQDCLIKFGDDETTFKAEYIGCDAEKKAWLWGWSENAEKFPAELFTLSNKLKQFGIDNEALYCKNARYDLPHEQFGRFLAGAVTTMHNCSYAVCNTEKGRLFIALADAPAEIYESVDAVTFVNISKHCLQANKINHKLFVEGFLLLNGTSYKTEGDRIVAGFDREVTIEFDLHNSELKVSKMHVAAVEGEETK